MLHKGNSSIFCYTAIRRHEDILLEIDCQSKPLSESSYIPQHAFLRLSAGGMPNTVFENIGKTSIGRQG